MQLWPNEEVNVQESSQQVENLWGELKSLQHSDPEERWKRFKICILLNIQSAEFDHTVVNLYEKPDLTYVEAVSRLRHEELRRQNTKEAQQGAIAMQAAAKGKSNIAGQNENKNETRTCFHCGIKGHIKRDCQKRK